MGALAKTDNEQLEKLTAIIGSEAEVIDMFAVVIVKTAEGDPVKLKAGALFLSALQEQYNRLRRISDANIILSSIQK